MFGFDVSTIHNLFFFSFVVSVCLLAKAAWLDGEEREVWIDRLNYRKERRFV